jgi:hypothetical protein
MEAIFGNALATGRFALGSGEALGQNQSDSVPTKIEGPPLAPPTTVQAPTAPARGSKATDKPTSAGNKRKTGNFSEEILMITNMSDAVNNVANALRETGLWAC